MASEHVLALKWRPHNFAQMIGQDAILPALINSLDHNRLHHAYLFTGTRGVGKTSVARILAKCLNCEAGISSTPCNTCNTCTAIDSGHFIDLIEVDAASRTKVEDTRELLDNVQYTPTQGRFKIYLIDEVHMLSGHSFNALLKTLEEPPSHVKFLLATTDPQKLPVTVLSRCLQFNLKHVASTALQKHFEHILQAEKITFDERSLALLASAARGSVRDGLSLLDQAIAHCNGHLVVDKVRAMLGNTDQETIWQLVGALVAAQPETLLDIVNAIADYTPDFSHVAEDLLTALHDIAIAQFAPKSTDNQQIINYAAQLPKETVQLYYQIALIGRRDLHLATNPKAGFEMLLLRLLAFQPVTHETTLTPKKSSNIIQYDHKTPLDPLKNWTNFVNRLQLTGMAQALVSHCSVKGFEGSTLELLLSEKHKPILNQKLHDRLQQAISALLQTPITLHISLGEPTSDTPAKVQQQKQETALKIASKTIHSDEYVQQLMSTFNAEVKPGSLQAEPNAVKDTD